MKDSHRLPAGRVLLVTLVSVVLAAVLLPLVTQAAPLIMLPPPPLPPPPPPPQAEARSKPAGAWLELRARFPATWPWAEMGWQEVWTVVQWQDPRTGVWRDVEGWRGGLDGIAADEGGAVVGEKGWWVAECNLGTGPFRWRITQGEGGRLLGTSEPFDLPGSSGASVTIEVPLE